MALSRRATLAATGLIPAGLLARCAQPVAAAPIGPIASRMSRLSSLHDAWNAADCVGGSACTNAAYAAVFRMEQEILDMMPETPADAVALLAVAVQEIDLLSDCENDDDRIRNAARAVNRASKTLAAHLGIDRRGLVHDAYINGLSDTVLA